MNKNGNGSLRRRMVATKVRPSIGHVLRTLQTRFADAAFDWIITKSNRALPVIMSKYAGMEARSEERLEDYETI